MILYLEDLFYDDRSEPKVALHRNPFFQKLLAEFAGTALFVFLGCSTVASATLTGAQSGIGQVALSWGMSLAITIYCFASVSGAHFNPAVSFAMYLKDPKSFGLSDMFGYIVVQFLGAFVAGLFTYLCYIDFFTAANNNSISKTDIMGLAEFYPNPSLGKSVTIQPGRAFFIEALGTAILVFVICAVTDPKQGTVSSTPAMIPLIIGLTLFALINITGALTMACFNPAREMGPRLVAYLMFPDCEWLSDKGWWIYEIAPMLGGPIGVILYLIFLGPTLSLRKEEEKGKKPEDQYCLLSCTKSDGEA